MRKFEIIAAAMLFGSFFTPWSKLFAAKGSGFQLARNPEIQGSGLFVIPVLALIILLCLMAGKRIRWVQFLVGLVPLLSLVGSIIYLGKQGGSDPISVFSNIKPFIDWGVYFAIACGLVLSLLALFGREKKNDT